MYGAWRSRDFSWVSGRRFFVEKRSGLLIPISTTLTLDVKKEGVDALAILKKRNYSSLSQFKPHNWNKTL